jgi:flagellin
MHVSCEERLMSSTLYNSASLSALQALNMTQQSLNTVQNQVSTGLAVATAADNSSYWSVAAQLNQDNGVVTAANTALTEGQSMLKTASSAINSVITTLNSMATALTEAQTPNANITAINTSLASLGSELTDAVNNASFNGLNMLNGTVTTVVASGAPTGAGSTAGVGFVSGYNATTNGGTVNTIDIATQMVYGAAPAALTSAATASTMTLAQAATEQFAQAATATGVLSAYTTAGANPLTLATSTLAAAGPTFADYANAATFAYTTQEWNSNGSITQTTYTAVDSSGKTKANGGAITGFTTTLGVAGFDVSSQTLTAAGDSNGLVVQNGVDLTALGSNSLSVISSGPDTNTQVTATDALNAVNAALTAVTSYASTIGATQDRMTSANTFNTALTTNLESGVAGLVNADMNTASTQLQALQTQEQLGIQSLSIANQNSALILKLFQ